ncbi:MAG: cobalt transporter CbiM [bacterium]
MHIPDGCLCPYTCLTCFAIAFPLWFTASKKSSKLLKEKYFQMLAAIGAAFSFSIMMFNVPIPGGTTGHAIGAALLSIIFGPWVSSILVTIALLSQALLFGDGGITTFAANSLIIAFIPSFTGYYIFKLLNKNKSDNLFKQSILAGLSGYFSIFLASLIAGIILGIQPIISHDNSGKALYFFYPLSVSVPAMVSEHLSLFCWVEMIITSIIYGLLNFNLLNNFFPCHREVQTRSCPENKGS